SFAPGSSLPTKPSAGARLRAAISMPASTSSFTALAFAPGALNTGTPRAFIALIGMLLVPAPARAIAFTLRGMSRECMSAERTRIASGSATSLPTVYCPAGRRFRPFSEIWFRTRTLNDPVLAMLRLEFLHVRDQRLHSLYRHRV